MSAATAGSVVNFYEKRAKVTHGRLNKARADWLLSSTFREWNRSRFSLLAVTQTHSEMGSCITGLQICRRVPENQSGLVGLGPQQELATPILPCLHPSWDLEPHRCLFQPGWTSTLLGMTSGWFSGLGPAGLLLRV